MNADYPSSLRFFTETKEVFQLLLRKFDPLTLGHYFQVTVLGSVDVLIRNQMV